MLYTWIRFWTDIADNGAGFGKRGLEDATMRVARALSLNSLWRGRGYPERI